jgi:hypothetical protein
MSDSLTSGILKKSQVKRILKYVETGIAPDDMNDSPTPASTATNEAFEQRFQSEYLIQLLTTPENELYTKSPQELDLHILQRMYQKEYQGLSDKTPSRPWQPMEANYLMIEVCSDLALAQMAKNHSRTCLAIQHQLWLSRRDKDDFDILATKYQITPEIVDYCLKYEIGSDRPYATYIMGPWTSIERQILKTEMLALIPLNDIQTMLPNAYLKDIMVDWIVADPGAFDSILPQIAQTYNFDDPDFVVDYMRARKMADNRSECCKTIQALAELSTRKWILNTESGEYRVVNNASPLSSSFAMDAKLTTDCRTCSGCQEKQREIDRLTNLIDTIASLMQQSDR